MKINGKQRKINEKQWKFNETQWKFNGKPMGNQWKSMKINRKTTQTNEIYEKRRKPL